MKYINNFNKYKKTNEYLNFNDLKFRTDITNSMSEYFLRHSDFIKDNNFNLLDNDNYSITKSNFIIDWELVIDARNYGIKDMSIVIHKIIGEFTIGLWQEDHDNEESSFSFDSNKMGYKIINSVEISSTIAPSEIEIDFKLKIITIS